MYLCIYTIYFILILYLFGLGLQRVNILKCVSDIQTKLHPYSMLHFSPFFSCIYFCRHFTGGRKGQACRGDKDLPSLVAYIF